jgi:Fe-Mn family superoxide dismutase
MVLNLLSLQGIVFFYPYLSTFDAKEISMPHVAKNYKHLIGEVKGLSEKQLMAHFGLYEGYIKKLNEVEEKLKTVDRSNANYSFAEVSELHRRRSVPFNGAYLHQIYFENLTGKATQPSQRLKDAIARDFGSIENWLMDMKAGITSAYGWVLLTRSRIHGSLRNDLIEEHHRGILVEQDIILALDGWEHAYMIDYGTAKAEYVKILEKAINWDIASQRFEAAESLPKIAAA